MLRERAGQGCLYLIGIVFGVAGATRLDLLGVPAAVTIVLGVAFGLGIGRFLSSESETKNKP